MVLESKVTNVNNDIENGNVIERVVSESDTLKIDSEIVSERETVISVSYTHLDVYKRQGLLIQNIRIPSIMLTIMLIVIN